MLDSYGIPTGMAIGAGAVVVPAALVFAAFFSASGDKEMKLAKQTFVVGEAITVLAALGLAYHLGTKSPVAQGVILGMVALPVLYAAGLGVDALDKQFPKVGLRQLF